MSFKNMSLPTSDILGDTHDAMSRAVELADENTDLTTELHHTQLDAHSTTHTLTHRLNHTRVRECIKMG